MGPLAVVYNIASNKPPRYRDEPEESEDVTPTDGDELETYVDDDDISPLDDTPAQGLSGRATQLVPESLRHAWSAIVRWVKGPYPPRPWAITPIFPKAQTAPIQILNMYVPKLRHRFFLLLLLYFGWILCFALVLRKSAFTSNVSGYGAPVRLSCGTSFWRDKNRCGVDGNNCRPFNNYTLAFRCPANCIKAQVYNPHAVGAQEILYHPLIIGGPEVPGGAVDTAVYRGDSFICGAAIHSGFIKNAEGGCGVVSLTGKGANYLSVSQHGMSSFGFDSTFPRSFKFLPDTRSSCKDLRWPLLAVSVTFTTILSIFTTSPAVFFGSIFTALFFHVGLVSDPPNLADYYLLVSISLGRFLPAAFVMFVIYRTSIFRTLNGLEAQFEKTVLWLGACWVGALNNHTFDKIPIQRLTPHDLKQPGAVTALIIIVLVIFSIALGQAWAIRIEGKMPRYLAVYAAFVFSLLMLVTIPHMNVRIHHYILALLLVPGTAMQNRPSLLYQGLLIGLFINGIARWGFDSILQTPGELIGDGPLGTLLPNITTPLIGAGAKNITFTWDSLPEGYNGFSILVNDVERFRGFEDYGSDNFTWERKHGIDVKYPEYFRFGYMEGSRPADYTKAGIWNADGSWTEMQPGPS